MDHKREYSAKIMKNRFHQLGQVLNENLKVIAIISLTVFLFILFFQPFPLEKFDFDNRLLFIAGFGAMAFFFMFIMSILIPWIAEKSKDNGDELALRVYIDGLIILILCSVAFTFYLRYVGSVHITFYIVFKVVLICLVPPASLRLYDGYKKLIRQNESLVAERKMVQKKIEKYEEESLNKSIIFVSESGTESLTILVADLIYVLSADNYVEIIFKEEEIIRKKLIRNTLKNVEAQLKQYSNFLRTHRTCIVNLHYVEKLHRDFSSHFISVRGYNEKLPVSRQYLIKLKEAL